jgi:hypothetical protein
VREPVRDVRTAAAELPAQPGVTGSPEALPRSEA